MICLCLPCSLYPDLKEGVIIKSVLPGSPAEKGGLHAGDVIIEFAGKPVSSPKDVTHSLGYEVGKKMCMKVLRDGKKDAQVFCFVTEPMRPVRHYRQYHRF